MGWKDDFFSQFEPRETATHAYDAPIDRDTKLQMHLRDVTVDAAADHTHTFTTETSGGSETRPRNIALLYCIKT